MAIGIAFWAGEFDLMKTGNIFTVSRWNTPYCEEEVGDTGKVSGLGWSGGGGPPRPIQCTVFALWRQYPRMPPADIPSAVAVLLMAAGMSSHHLSFPRTAAMEFGGVLPEWKISSTFSLNGFQPLFTLEPFVIFTHRYKTFVQCNFWLKP